ncbi:MAG: ATP-dependent RecD-like DNA helicase [Planctomycetota bacterium]|jgi:exodeoxyribonuclease V alpha subunit|nr:ATP-dependent RecD-like DNA helicase [Planctomycetota bacterium]MDP6407919.1 ATP-dependent RecD-like DNA helicase [Planctomycetota bacterium]MDP6540702.1 ATP-dependent RecD-like DNA helicase [Planctomycetota bacterium]
MAQDDRRTRRNEGGTPAAATMLVGSVERVTYQSPETLYTVLRVSPERGYDDPEDPSMFRAERVTAVGKTPMPHAGQRVRLTGTWRTHATHGRQFAFESLEPLPPTDTGGLVRYLASSAFRGIGDTLARRIVEHLGATTLERIREDPACLEGVRGLRGKVAADLVERVRVELGAHKAHAFLRGLGLGPWQAATVVTTLGADCETRLREDPFLLADEVSGLGFVTADRVARELGIEGADPRRARAGLLHTLNAARDDGHTLLARERLLESTLELLGESARSTVVEESLDGMTGSGELVARTDDDGLQHLYLPHLAHCEGALARNLAGLLASGPARPLAAEGDLARAESAAELRLHADQRSAVLGLLAEPVALLTGGPGVGKTTIIRLVVELAERAGVGVLLASPTGRAAKRLAEATGREARTIHRTLGFEHGGGFEHDANHPLEADLVIVDEISMLDVVLAHHLLKAVAPPTRLVLVGDPDQLPSVGPGNVLSDLLASERIPVHRLTRIFRQAEGSLIVENAYRVLRGETPSFPGRGDTQSDFYFFPAEEPQECAERVVDIVTRRIPETFGLAWETDVQVIAPMYRGPCGVDALNGLLREAQGSGGREVQRGSRTWRTGDRVIHTRNDYEKRVFNGDMGRIVRIASSDGLEVVVAYPDREVVYSSGELSDLRPAFAITVHRSQGGEFDGVVLPLVAQHFMMLQRNLLYTAITRARKLVVLVGSRRALEIAVRNTDQSRRESALADRLAKITDS